MSDAFWTTIGLVTLALIQLWREYMAHARAQKVQQAIGHNTTETVKAKNAAVTAVRSTDQVIERVNGQREAMIEAAKVMQERITALELMLAEKLQIEAVKETVKVVVAEIKVNGKGLGQ